MTNLYNERPAWLDNAHRDLDAAVAAAYGWPADIGEEDALARLLELNRERAAAGVREIAPHSGCFPSRLAGVTRHPARELRPYFRTCRETAPRAPAASG